MSKDTADDDPRDDKRREAKNAGDDGGDGSPSRPLTAAEAIAVARASAKEAAAATAQESASGSGQKPAPEDATPASAEAGGGAEEPASGGSDESSIEKSAEAAEPPQASPAASSDRDADGPAEAGDTAQPAAPSGGTAAQPAPDPTPMPPPAPSPEPPPAQSAPQRPMATPIAWLALVLVLLLAAGGFSQLLEIQRREAALLERLQGLEAVSGQDTTTFDQMRDNLQRQIELELEGIEARQARAEEDQERTAARLEAMLTERAGATRGALNRELEALRSELDAQEQRLREQQQRLGDLSVEDRQSWQLAEVQYLLRLANQRLIMTGDTASAEALLRSVDDILRDLDDPQVHDLREAVASDLAAVRAVPRLDTQGLYLRLAALIRQTDDLVLFELPERAPEVEAAPAEDWRGRLAEGFDTAVDKLSEYIVVSRRDVPVEALMDPQYEGLVRQNMRMLLEQAQVALLSGNEMLYRQSLERAEGWVTQFFKSDEQAARAMAEELQQLREERVSVTLPDLSGSLSALGEVMKSRLAAAGA